MRDGASTDVGPRRAVLGTGCHSAARFREARCPLCSLLSQTQPTTLPVLTVFPMSLCFRLLLKAGVAGRLLAQDVLWTPAFGEYRGKRVGWGGRSTSEGTWAGPCGRALP